MPAAALAQEFDGAALHDVLAGQVIEFARCLAPLALFGAALDVVHDADRSGPLHVA
jgi:hypothetical protein